MAPRRVGQERLAMTESGRERLVDLKARGLAVPPELAVGDGALGFWKALDEVFPGTRHQRCWFHKIANVLEHFPKSMQPAVAADLREVSHAETRAAARLAKDTEVLLAFRDFPAEHWEHLRSANPIESVFATVRHRTVLLSTVCRTRAGRVSQMSVGTTLLYRFILLLFLVTAMQSGIVQRNAKFVR